jgi:hypothetical protein
MRLHRPDNQRFREEAETTLGSRFFAEQTAGARQHPKMGNWSLSPYLFYLSWTVYLGLTRPHAFCQT